MAAFVYNNTIIAPRLFAHVLQQLVVYLPTLDDCLLPNMQEI